MSAKYNGLIFRTNLEAHWAAFFDLAGWDWKINPESINDWSPDFHVTFPCGHSECSGSHTILISVLPLSKIEDFGNHPCLSYAYGNDENEISADSGAAFGFGPSVTKWEMAHGAGGGIENVYNWVDNADELWQRANDQVKECFSEII